MSFYPIWKTPVEQSARRRMAGGETMTLKILSSRPVVVRNGRIVSNRSRHVTGYLVYVNGEIWPRNQPAGGDTKARAKALCQRVKKEMGKASVTMKPEYRL